MRDVIAGIASPRHRGAARVITGALAVASITAAVELIPLRRQAADMPDAVFIREHYAKHEYRIPMRDGARLFTIVYVPRDSARRYPIVLQRTPFSVAPYGPDAYARTLGPDRFMMHEGRGRLSDRQRPSQ